MTDFYVKATGDNRYGGGTDRWLKIRNIHKKGGGFEIEVRIRGQRKFVYVNNNEDIYYLKFAKGWPGLMPVSYRTVLRGMVKGYGRGQNA
jgi:hypothetical protein